MIPKTLQQSDYRIRKLIGILGLCLPFLLVITQAEFLASISHYYYGRLSGVLFIIILSAFALFLISYKGYTIDVTTEKFSDDLITNIGGFAALVVVFIPTRCAESGSDAINMLCNSKCLPYLGHNNATESMVHFISAGIFILAMGWMSKYKFTRGQNTINNRIYKCCGNVVFICVAVIITLSVLEWFNVEFWLRNYYVFVFETIAVIAFGISWLIKGKAIEEVKQMLKMS